MKAPRLSAMPLAALFLIACQSSGGANEVSFPDDAEPTAALGMVAVQQRGCAMCHQSSNPDDGVLSGQTTPVPGTQSYGANLTPDPDTGMDAWDAATIATAVLGGVDDQSEELCLAMPRFATKGMNTTEALSIAAYLQSLPAVWRAIPASTCTQTTGPGGADGGGDR